MRQPFARRRRTSRPRRRSPPAYPAGLALGRDGTAVVGRSTDEDGTTVHVRAPGRPRPSRSTGTRESAGVGDLSRRRHAGRHRAHRARRRDARGAARRPAADGTHGRRAGRHRGGTRELGLAVPGLRPASPATPRLLVGHQRRGRWEPMIWDLGDAASETAARPSTCPATSPPSGTRTAPRCWSRTSYQARSELFRYDLGDRRADPLDTPARLGRRARPRGRTARWSSCGPRPPSRRRSASTTGAVGAGPARAGGAGLRAGRGRLGRRARAAAVHALVPDARPGAGPFPTVFEVHGGPTCHDSDAFAAGPAAWVDHGFAVVRVNYRGSTGYGRAWTDALKHRVGLIELEDIAAVRDWAVGSGPRRPDRLVLAGGSWGGYLTLLGLGTQPEAWAVGLAAVPVADYVTAYDDEMEALKALDRTLFGGSPEEVPERYAASSPLTYVDEVQAPVYIIGGRERPALPDPADRQLRGRGWSERGTPHEVYRYDAGHGSLVVEERIKQVRLEIDFAVCGIFRRRDRDGGGIRCQPHRVGSPPE